MAERRDTKNRLLNKGEYQKSDGRYMYRYIDAQGESKFVYSWTLTQTDRPPKGRLPCRCLREIEKDIARDLQDQIDFQKARHTTLNALYDDYMEQKHEIKPTTRATYRYTYDTHIRNGLGKRKISDIKYSDIKKLYNGLVRNGTLKASTLGNLHSILHPIFAIAVRDGYIRTNPTAGVLEEVRKINHWEQPKRHALTESEQASLLKFVRTNEMYAFWAPLFIVLLGTGGRIGEIAGLRWDDCDFENGIININHSLQYRPDATTHKLRFAISTPKTQAGRREIPMLSQVKEALLMEKKRQAEEGGCTIEVDGYSGFIFMTRRGNLLAPAHFNRITGDIIRDHNASEQTTAREQGREPVLLPAFSAHSLRHTFCTRMCENVTNTKVIQEIMGHANITMTMNIYNEATLDKKKEVFTGLEGKIQLC